MHEEFVVSVVGPKGASDNGSIGRLMTGSNHRPCTVVEYRKECTHSHSAKIAWGSHGSVQHVTHDIIEPAKDVSAIATGVMSEKPCTTALAARLLLKLEV